MLPFVGIPLGLIQAVIIADVGSSDTAIAALISGIFLTINTILTIVIQRGLTHGHVKPRRRKRPEEGGEEDADNNQPSTNTNGEATKPHDSDDARRTPSEKVD